MPWIEKEPLKEPSPKPELTKPTPTVPNRTVTPMIVEPDRSRFKEFLPKPRAM